jgi:hypothetical protein
MFGFWWRDGRKPVLAEIASALPAALEALHPVEGATVLLLANCMLGYAGRTFGRDFALDPRRADVKAARPLLDSLIQVRRGLAAMARDAAGGRRRHIACHLRAAELVLLTAGLALGPEHARQVSRCWKAVWLARGSLRQAVPWLRNYERVSGVGAVPSLADGREPSDIDLLRIGASVPPFLRRRKS